jgi:predicted RNase H-like HicB family nuclease
MDRFGFSFTLKSITLDCAKEKCWMKLPKLTAVIEKEGKWYVATCPELGVASQGRTNDEAELMLQEAVELLIEEAGEAEISRRLNRGVKVKNLELAHA